MKTILFETNFNQKLSCDRFAHIDLPPSKEITREQMDETKIEIHVADKSHPPVHVKVESIISLRLEQLSNIHTWPSHGMSTTEFIHWQHLRKKGGVNGDTLLAVYYYKKI